MFKGGLKMYFAAIKRQSKRKCYRINVRAKLLFLANVPFQLHACFLPYQPVYNNVDK
ncbi:MAG TPA: hypothetical protein PK910_08500 [Bacteroidales bacterium]|nr:hypothetical protein [Bacteroidales bacterium]HRC90040.1 hypothetical protein [Bacteroidales bacterium]